MTEDDKAAFVELLRKAIEGDRFRLSPPMKRLRGIPAKLAPPAPRPEPLLPPKPCGAISSWWCGGEEGESTDD